MHRNYALVADVDPKRLDEAISERVERLRALAADHDPLSVVANLALSALPLPGREFVESELEGVGVYAELAAGLLLPVARGAVGPPIGADVLAPARDVLGELTGLLTLQARARAHASGVAPAEADARSRAMAHHLWVVGTGYAWQERQVLLDLFDDADLAARLRDRIGFDVRQGLACAAAVGELIGEKLDQRFDDSAELYHAARAGQDDAGLRALAEEAAAQWDCPADEALRRLLGAWTFHDLGDVLALDRDELAAQADVGAPVAQAYLAALTAALDEPLGPLSALEAVRQRPFLSVGDGRVLLASPSADFWALRGVLEATLARGSHAERYFRRRARTLERCVAEQLRDALRPDELHRSVRFAGAIDGRAVEGEIDVLARLGDVVLVVEAKSATTPISGRRGGDRLIGFLRENLAKAALQGHAAKLATLGGDAVALTDERGRPLRLSGAPVREVHPIVVTLDDLSVVAPTLNRMAGTRVLPAGLTVPWLVSLHQLDTICELVELPVQLVHFLRRRARLGQLGEREAIEELDYWMLYLSRNLYFEEEPTTVPVRYASLTDRLDAWALFAHGMRETPAPKPRQRFGEGVEALLAELDARRPEGWVAAACALLDAAPDARGRVAGQLPLLRARAQRRRAVQRATFAFEEGPDPFTLVVVAAPDDAPEPLGSLLRASVAQRRAELGVPRIVGLGAQTGSNSAFDELFVVEPRWSLP